MLGTPLYEKGVKKLKEGENLNGKVVTRQLKKDDRVDVTTDAGKRILKCEVTMNPSKGLDTVALQCEGHMFHMRIEEKTKWMLQGKSSGGTGKLRNNNTRLEVEKIEKLSKEEVAERIKEERAEEAAKKAAEEAVKGAQETPATAEAAKKAADASEDRLAAAAAAQPAPEPLAPPAAGSAAPPPILEPELTERQSKIATLRAMTDQLQSELQRLRNEVTTNQHICHDKLNAMKDAVSSEMRGLNAEMEDHEFPFFKTIGKKITSQITPPKNVVNSIPS